MKVKVEENMTTLQKAINGKEIKRYEYSQFI